MNPTDALASALRSTSSAAARPATPSPRPGEAVVRHGAEFEAVFEAAAREANAVQPPIVQTVRHESRKVAPLEKFEGFVLRSFVEEMLPSESSGYFGTGTAGSIWRSMLAEQIGNELAESGGIGIAKLLASRGEGAAVAAAEATRNAPELPIGSNAAFASPEPDQS